MSDTFDLARINAEFGNDPEALTRWALSLDKHAICTTNFRPFEAVILHMVTRFRPDISIVWMDNGYNTDATYRFADEVTRKLNLNRIIYLPQRTRAHREAVDGLTPHIDDPRHEAFTREVKLEPFERALRELNPEMWFTAVRASDTAFRAGMQPVSLNGDGLIKVAPVLHWSSKQMHEYLVAHDLPNEFDYVDPTKAEDNRECGLHLAH
ncbi:phosphoadenylylsulfate reductase [Cobetia marina]|uniref:phosphoadenosine phosphosulfate reductase domain-containing protein n=1 Tax=Cobetia marina TaxID=28258 RepID=UPI0010AE7D09|nr:phosphoadenosine phosphosulfate reductase family protein [Cobetia marina]TKD61933.1 phosphoadenylylsulfate reductase [Cobetia marina]